MHRTLLGRKKYEETMSDERPPFYMHQTRNLEVDGCSSKENLFGHSALLVNARYDCFSLR